MCIASANATVNATGNTNENKELLYLSSFIGGEGVQLLVDSG